MISPMHEALNTDGTREGELPPNNDVDRIPLEKRAPFQRVIAQLARGKQPADVSKDEWRAQNLAWFDEHRDAMTRIIDNPANTEIRDLAMEGNYEEAAKLVLPMLDEGSQALAA